jgi:hypothetical protein
MFCSNCACELPTIAKFCVRCGSRVEGQKSPPPLQVAIPPTVQPSAAAYARCSTCGGQNAGDYSFCTSCGAQLGPASSPSLVGVTPLEASVGPRTQVAQSSTFPVPLGDAAGVNISKSFDPPRVPPRHICEGKPLGSSPRLNFASPLC